MNANEQATVTEPVKCVMSFDSFISVSDAHIAVSRSGAFKIKRQVVALNEAVKAGVVFG